MVELHDAIVVCPHFVSELQEPAAAVITTSPKHGVTLITTCSLSEASLSSYIPTSKYFDLLELWELLLEEFPEIVTLFD